MKKINVTLFLVLFVFCSSFTQNNKLEYSKQLSIYNGLAHNGVTSILEDSKGYVWFGTYDGLNRYDGCALKTYKNTIEKNILVSNRVRTIAEDKNGNIWIGTDQGLSFYNYITERFENIYLNRLIKPSIDGPIIRKILIDHKKDLIICLTENDGVFLFNQDKTFLGKHSLSIGSKKSSSFYDGIKLDDHNYIFTSSSGLIIFNINTHKFNRILENKLVINTQSNCILSVHQNKLLVSLKRGLAEINYTKRNKTYYFDLKEVRFKNNRVTSLALDKHNNLWIGLLFNGIIKINDVDNFLTGKNYEKKLFSLKTGLTKTSYILPSKNSGCWIATFNEGIFQFGIDENPFKFINAQMRMSYGIKFNNVDKFALFDDSKILVSTGNNGISFFNIKDRSFEPLPFKISTQYQKSAHDVFVDSQKNIWCKIRGYGFVRIKPQENKIERINSHEHPALNYILPRSYTEDKNGNIWVCGTKNVYKIKLNKEREILSVESLNQDHLFFTKNKINLPRRLYTDPLHDYVWIGTDANGLFRIKIEHKDTPLRKLKIDQFVHNSDNQQSITSNFVSSIIRLPNEEFWVGTEGGGLCKVIDSHKTPSFISLSEKDGLSNNVIKNILFDQEYNLWVTTNIGLNKIDTKDLSIRKFTKEDGLPFEDFWFDSKLFKDGTMMMSGLNGFCYFNPKDISNKEALPRLDYGELKVLNKSIVPGDKYSKRVLIDKRLSEMKEINLNHDENIFSLELISLHFSNPDNHKLRYKLSPLNENWIEVPSNEREISYNGLQPGTYVLNVMASNSLHQWTEPKTLTITIAPPFWKTTWAYFIYCILFLTLIYLSVRIILRIQALNHNLQIEQLEKNKVKEINTAKLRFFSNVSHELKTPLTLIKGPVNMLIDEFSNRNDVTNKLNIIKRQSKKISQLINQVHDFQKAEAQALKTNFSIFSYNEFIEELLVDFKYMAAIENKKIQVFGSDKNIIVSADRDKLEKIFNNILSNAFKYTNPEDVIKINYASYEKDLIISISDTGKGIDAADLSHIFERFYQSRTQQDLYSSGSGIGLSFTKLLVEIHYGYISAESEIGKGTTIHIRLPIVKKKTAKDQENIKKAFLSSEEDFNLSSQLTSKSNPSEIKTEGDFSNTMVFYVEDNLDMRMYVTKTLSKYFKLKDFSNGQECLNAMEYEWPDLVISDIQMPELNGLDLCKALKSDIKTSHIPVVLLTALIKIEDKIQGIRDGADAYIKKPFNIQHLVTQTETLLSNRQQLRERYKISIPLTKENNVNNRNDNAFLEKLYNLIEENLDNQNLDLNDFVKELYLNRTHFYQKVKALTNRTPLELLKEYRLKKAAEFLVHKKVSVNEVYVMTGFKSRTHFSKLFKELYDVTPGKYAKGMEEKYNAN